MRLKISATPWMVGVSLLLGEHLAPGFAHGQEPGLQEWSRPIPVCSRAYCEEQVIYVTALDALLREAPACRNTPPGVLRTIHFAPYTAFGDALYGREMSHPGLPSSPALMSFDDVWNPFFRYWSEIQLLDAQEVLDGKIHPEACLFVFSTVTWITEDSVRVIVSESRSRPRNVRQLYVFLRRETAGWVLVRIETGLQS